MPIPIGWILLILAASVVCFWGYFSSNLIVFSERSLNEFTPAAFGQTFEPFEIETRDNLRLPGWWVKAKTPTDKTIVILHGWGANRSDRLASSLFLSERYNLAYFDFRGHGNAPSAQSSLTTKEIGDFEDAVKTLQERYPAATRRLAVYGFSMGGAVAISGAARMPAIQAVAVESPFSDYNETLTRYAKLFYRAPVWVSAITRLFVRLRLGFDPELDSPIFHVHRIAPRALFILQGNNDKRMPVSEGETLFDLAGDPKQIWTADDTDHGGIYETYPEEFKQRLGAFFDQYLGNVSFGEQDFKSN